MSNFEWLVADMRRREFRYWDSWLRNIAPIRRAFNKALGDDPLLYNETASAGLLAAAAIRAGDLALSEWVTIKHHSGPGRGHRNGRSDLWMFSKESGLSWSFECKMHWCTPGTRRATIQRRLEAACVDAWDVSRDDCDECFGLLILAPKDEKVPISEKVAGIILQTANEYAAFACRVGGNALPVYLLFAPARRR